MCAKLCRVVDKNKERLKELARTDRRYVVTHKIHSTNGLSQTSINSAIIEYDDNFGYSSEHKLSEIAYIKDNMLFIKVTKGLNVIGCKELIKNPWIGLLITDIKTNNTILMKREDVLNSNILDYSYNASYINNKTSIRVNAITSEDMKEIDRKVQENQRLYLEKHQREIERQKKYKINKQKHEQIALKNIQIGKKIVELMLMIDKSDILAFDAIHINNSVYLRYGDYTEHNNIDGYMIIDKEESDYYKKLYIKGWFLDEEYSLDYQRYCTEEVDDITFDTLGNLENICKASRCDDIGYMNEYYLSAKGRNYKISMYPDSYDGFLSIEDAGEFKGNSIVDVKSAVKNKNTLDTLIRVHKICKNFKKYSNMYKKPNIPILRYILAYLHSDDGKQYYDKVSNMLSSNNFSNKVYFTILASKLSK